MPTPYHSQYSARDLTLRRATGSVESLSRSISNARVDLNPHQLDAAPIADVFNRAGLIEKWRRGTNRVIAMCREAGIAPPTFRENYRQPAVAAGLIELTIPDKPNSRLQKHRLTEKGRRRLGERVGGSVDAPEGST